MDYEVIGKYNFIIYFKKSIRKKEKQCEHTLNMTTLHIFFLLFPNVTQSQWYHFNCVYLTLGKITRVK